MKNSMNTRKIRAHILTGFAALALMASPSANACHKYDVVCRAKEAAERIKAEAKKAAAAAKAAAEQAAAAAKAAAQAAAAAAKAAADRLAAAGADISQTEMDSIVSQTESAYSASSGALMNEYQQSLAALYAIYNDALEALFREAGRVAVNQKQQFLSSLHNNMMNLDDQGRQALNRIVRGIPTQQVTAQTRADLQTLASKLGLLTSQAGSILAGGSPQLTVEAASIPSCFGVVIGAHAEAYGGGETSFAIMMNTSGSDRSVALTISLGGTVGLEIGGAGMVGIAWATGSIANLAGPSVGFGVSAAVGPGASLGLSWNVSQGMSGAANAVPSFTLAFEVGAEAAIAFGGGQTWLLATY